MMMMICCSHDDDDMLQQHQLWRFTSTNMDIDGCSLELFPATLSATSPGIGHRNKFNSIV